MHAVAGGSLSINKIAATIASRPCSLWNRGWDACERWRLVAAADDPTEQRASSGLDKPHSGHGGCLQEGLSVSAVLKRGTAKHQACGRLASSGQSTNPEGICEG